ncbi:hypothetical protein B0H14DRAFT_2580584 [Mycena olivaceomarginata]|nr:hypothetical protein B0H14DRAFT_2580584 [Mycena olivaceomarginata]
MSVGIASHISRRNGTESYFIGTRNFLGGRDVQAAAERVPTAGYAHKAAARPAKLRAVNTLRRRRRDECKCEKKTVEFELHGRLGHPTPTVVLICVPGPLEAHYGDVGEGVVPVKTVKTRPVGLFGTPHGDEQMIVRREPVLLVIQGRQVPCHGRSNPLEPRIRLSYAADRRFTAGHTPTISFFPRINVIILYTTPGRVIAWRELFQFLGRQRLLGVGVGGALGLFLDPLGLLGPPPRTFFWIELSSCPPNKSRARQLILSRELSTASP